LASTLQPNSNPCLAENVALSNHQQDDSKVSVPMAESNDDMGFTGRPGSKPSPPSAATPSSTADYTGSAASAAAGIYCSWFICSREFLRCSGANISRGSDINTSAKQCSCSASSSDIVVVNFLQFFTYKLKLKLQYS
jgi:hypothetical protein